MDYDKMSVAELEALVAREKNAPVTAKGAAKAVGSGVAHIGVPATVGMLGDMGGLMQKYGAWGGERLRNLFNPPDYDKMSTAELQALVDKDKPKAPYAAPPVEYTDPEAGKREMEQLQADHAAGKIPTEAGAGVQFRSSLMPTSADVKGLMKKVVPEHFSENQTEDVLKDFGGLLVGAAAAPEMAMINSLKSGAKAIGTAATRYAAAPAGAAEGTREALKNTRFEKFSEPAAMVTSLLAPGALSKVVTRNPMSEPQLREQSILRAHGVKSGTPGQLTENITKQRMESGLADTPFTGTSAPGINVTKNQEFTTGAMKHVGLDNDPKLQKLLSEEGGMTGPVRAHVQQSTAAALAATKPQRGPGGKFLKAQPSAAAQAQDEAREILEKVAKVDPRGVITPEGLVKATSHLPDNHPLARYANAGARMLPDLKESGKGSAFAHNAALALILAGGAGATAYNQGHSALGEYGGYGAGLGLGALSGLFGGRLYHSRAGRAVLNNQILPKAVRPGMTKDAAQQLMMAEALAKVDRDRMQQ